jgi:HTH-type transcriptional regulator, competence development regulator
MNAALRAFGERLRDLRRAKGLTLRQLADATEVDFTYLSKLENGRVSYSPSADMVRKLAQALDADPLELLELANKLPPELDSVRGSANARRFMQRASEIASPEDGEAVLDLLEQREAERKRKMEDQ